MAAHVKPKLTQIEAFALERALEKLTSYRDEPDKVSLSRVLEKLRHELYARNASTKG